MQLEVIRWIALALLIIFTGYTIYCSVRENFWRACRGVFAYKWGRQVTIDLYLGLLLFVFFIFLNEGSVSAAVIWLIPTLILGNIVPLLYFVIYFDSIVQHFL
jgi:hypothetical protein